MSHQGTQQLEQGKEAAAQVVTATAVITSAVSGVAAEAEGEIFDIYDESGNYLGTELRSVCHATGLYHRAVYCFMFNSQGEMLIQRRSSKKKVGPNQWDMSVAEHLSPGETYQQAVARGLVEELGIQLQPELIQGPLQPRHISKLILPDIGVYDYEFLESYRVDCYDGPVHFNPEEVAEVKFVTLDFLREHMQKEPEAFTAWFHKELNSLNFFAADPALN